MSETYAIFSARYYPSTGGVESYTFNLADCLVSQGHRVVVVAMQTGTAPAQEVQANGVELVRLPAYSLMDGRLPLSKKNAEYKALLRQLESTGVTRVLVNTRFYRHSLEGLRFAHRLGLPVVLLDHGSMHLTIGNPLADRVIARYEHVVTTRGMRFQPIYAGVSHKSIRWLEHFGIHTDRVIPNAIDVDAFLAESSRRDFRRELGVRDDELLVGFVGRLTPEKGPDKLVSAARLVAAPNLRFAFAGEGPLGEELVGTAPASCSFLGRLDRSDLSAFLQSCDAFCLPSRSEGFCTSLLEASACGLVSIITDVGGARELIPDGGFGCIIDDDDPTTVAAALEVIASLEDEARMQMGARAQAHVREHHDWPASVRALEAAFGDPGTADSRNSL